MPAKPKPVPKWPSGKRLRIRAYRQGLGDCFLLTFAGKPKPVHVMIDCGVVLGTKDPADKMVPVAENIKAITGGKVDVLVITHEHWDHLSGFTKGQAQKVFDGVTFGRLWTAWTEDPKDELAKKLRKERELKKAAAKKTKAKLAGLQSQGLKVSAERLAALDGVLGFFGAAAVDDEGGGKEGTGDALDYLKSRISHQEFFLPGEKPLTIPGVPGVRLFVLGPPHDKTKLGSTDPRKGEGYGLVDAFAAAAGVQPNGGNEGERHQPFGTEFRRGEPQGHTGPLYEAQDAAWRRIDADWLGVGERLALQLDDDTNNTSLVLAVEFIETEEVLLFVGDAQAGNWRSWDEYKWNVPDKDGRQQTVTAESLLNRTVFYKVGHHGSHNATLREKGLERMTSPSLISFIPVDQKVAREIKNWKHMPLDALCERLKEKSAALYRSDTGKAAGNTPSGAKINEEELYVDFWY